MQNSSNRRPIILWATAAAAVLMIVGGIAPWATVLGAIDIDGTHGDGWFLIIGGILAGALLIWHASTPRMWKAIVITLLGLMGTIVAAVDLSNIRSFAGQSGGLISTGWGLYVSLLSSIGLLAAGIYTIVKRPYAAETGARSTDAPVAQADTGAAKPAPGSHRTAPPMSP